MAGEEFRERDPFAPITYVYTDVRLLHTEVSRYQKIDVFEHPYFGRMLILNDVVQLTERDEFFYHEMLVHVPLHVHPTGENILVIGGGDGGSLREVLKHVGVRQVSLVEIDGQVIEVSKRFFPSMARAFDDERVIVHQKDGAKYFENTPEIYDVIIVDSTDPVGFARRLFSSEFYQTAFKALASNGILVAQTESLLFHRDVVVETQRNMKTIFPVVDLYTQPIATYAGNWWSFSIALKEGNPRVPVKRRVVPTRYYSRDTHRMSFLPRRFYRRLLAGELQW